MKIKQCCSVHQIVFSCGELYDLFTRFRLLRMAVPGGPWSGRQLLDQLGATAARDCCQALKKHFFSI